MDSLTLTKKQHQEMISHIEEACGLLAGRNTTVEAVIGVTNQAQSPQRYVMDPIEQLKAFEWIDSKGLELLGIFHSHPAGPETVSPTDIAEAAYGVVFIVLSRTQSTRDWRTRGFWITNGESREVTLEIK